MITDTHIHLYDPTRPQGVPWPDPNDEVLYRTTLPERFRELAAPHGVTGVVVVEASEWVEDNQWVLDLAEEEPLIVGLVGNLQPGTDGFAGHLDRLAANPLFRGIRPRGSDTARLSDGRALADLERLIEKDLQVDLVFGAQELPAAIRLAEHLPVLRIVIDHIGGGRIRDGQPDPAWVKGMKELASHPNVYCKVSALAEHSGSRPAPTDPAYYVPTLDALWDAFGEDRLVYGSNWPVCEHFASYATVFRIVDNYFTAKGAAAREKYFRKNGEAAYRWVERE